MAKYQVALEGTSQEILTKTDDVKGQVGTVQQTADKIYDYLESQSSDAKNVSRVDPRTGAISIENLTGGAPAMPDKLNYTNPIYTEAVEGTRTGWLGLPRVHVNNPKLGDDADRYVYIFGAMNTVGYRYDLEKEDYDFCNIEVPEYLFNASYTTVDGKIFVIKNYNMYLYDTNFFHTPEEKIEKIASCPYNMNGCTMIYVPTSVIPANTGYTDYELDENGEPTEELHQGYIHIFGGDPILATNRTKHYMFNPVTYTWFDVSARYKVPVECIYGNAVEYNGSIYLLTGGATATTTFYRILTIQNPSGEIEFIKLVVAPVTIKNNAMMLVKPINKEGTSSELVPATVWLAANGTARHYYNIKEGTWTTLAVNPIPVMEKSWVYRNGLFYTFNAPAPTGFLNLSVHVDQNVLDPSLEIVNRYVSNKDHEAFYTTKENSQMMIWSPINSIYCVIGRMAYFFGGGEAIATTYLTNTYHNAVLDLNTRKWGVMGDAPVVTDSASETSKQYGFSNQQTLCTVPRLTEEGKVDISEDKTLIKKDIYIFGVKDSVAYNAFFGNHAVKYTSEFEVTDYEMPDGTIEKNYVVKPGEFTILKDTPVIFNYSCAVPVATGQDEDGNYIYNEIWFFGGGEGTATAKTSIYKYDIKEDTYTLSSAVTPVPFYQLNHLHVYRPECNKAFFFHATTKNLYVFDFHTQDWAIVALDELEAAPTVNTVAYTSNNDDWVYLTGMNTRVLIPADGDVTKIETAYYYLPLTVDNPYMYPYLTQEGLNTLDEEGNPKVDMQKNNEVYSLRGDMKGTLRDWKSRRFIQQFNTITEELASSGWMFLLANTTVYYEGALMGVHNNTVGYEELESSFDSNDYTRSHKYYKIKDAGYYRLDDDTLSFTLVS